MGPLIKPLLWLSAIFYNLFFVVQKNNEQEAVGNKFSNLIVNFKNKFFKINDNSIQRKIPKIRKNTISVKNKLDDEPKILKNKKKCSTR